MPTLPEEERTEVRRLKKELDELNEQADEALFEAHLRQQEVAGIEGRYSCTSLYLDGKSLKQCEINPGHPTAHTAGRIAWTDEGEYGRITVTNHGE